MKIGYWFHNIVNIQLVEIYLALPIMSFTRIEFRIYNVLSRSTQTTNANNKRGYH